MRRQIALCIGNDDYQYECLNKLNCAVNDCKTIAAKLQSLNFDVYYYVNLNRESMHKVIDEFETMLDNYDVALFYYAGHGFECKGKNLLMPIDTDGVDDNYKEWAALNLDYLINALEGKNITNSLKTKIIILDACRGHGNGRGGTTKGFAPIFAPEGTIIAFSTSPGQNAFEYGEHGAYTQALLQSIDLPRISIENMFKHVREILSATTNGHQISWEHTSLMGNYCFNEDSIDAFPFYSSDAIADKNYYFRTDNQLYPIIELLKSYDYYKQNEAINKLYHLSLISSSPNDLFVLGRNIYQAAEGGAWKVQDYIRDFVSNPTPIEVKKHILTGMAFEIYFNRNGTLRENFKPNNYILILRLLENETYQMSKNFISSKLINETNQMLYIPSSENKIDLHLQCIKYDTMENGDIIYYVESIYNQGSNILLSGDGTYNIDANSDWYSNAVSLSELRVILARKLLAPPDMILLTSSIDEKNNHYFALPISYSLRRKKIIEK